MKTPIILYMVIQPFIACANDARATCKSLFEIIESYDRPVKNKIDLEFNEAIDKWAAKIQEDSLETEWVRLQKERLQEEKDIPPEYVESLKSTINTIFFTSAIAKKNEPVIKLTLSNAPVGLVHPLVRPEFHLVRKLGAQSFENVFEAYVKSSSLQAKAWLTEVVRSSFFYLKDEEWMETDSDEIVMKKMNIWFKQHALALRPVEVYRPISSRKSYFSQGIKENETLLGLFFLKQERDRGR